VSSVQRAVGQIRHLSAFSKVRSESKNAADIWHYWRELFGQAFWDSLLFFFETPEGAWKGVGIILLGMLVTTAIVWRARSREAFTGLTAAPPKPN
jgi:hypothetical protein